MTATVNIHKPNDPGIQLTEAALTHVLQHISKNFPVSVTKKIELQTKVRFHFKLK